MEISPDSPIWDLLARWEEQRRQGQGVTVEELCHCHPELIEPMREAIHALESTSWLDKPITEEPEYRSQDLNFPAAIGEYNLLEQIGVGGMGQVYKARHRRMDRIVAVKILPEGAVTSAESLARFQQEVQAAAKLHHPSIVIAYDAGEIAGRPYLVMEYVEGTDLARLLQSHGPVSVKQVIDIISQVALALDYAHGKGIVHGDIKPGNLLLAADGTVKILDLGLARFKATTEGEPVAGTVDYLPPERMTLAAPVDPRSDIYSLGCTLFTLLTGKPPLSGATAVEKMLAHREGRIPSLRQKRPDVPAALDNAFRRMVAKNPADRFQTMEEVVHALSRTPSSNKWLWAGLFILLFACFVAGWVFTRPGNPPLKRLNLDFTQIDDDALSQVPDLADLGELRLNRTKITDKGLLSLQSCKRLEYLDVSQNPITDSGLETLSELDQLTHVALSATKITDDGLKHLTPLRKLRHLNLDYTQISDEGLKHLRGMTALQDVRLTQTKITDAGLVHLAGLKSLRLLDLQRTAITDDGLKHLDGLPDLHEIVLAGTKTTLRRK